MFGWRPHKNPSQHDENVRAAGETLPTSLRRSFQGHVQRSWLFHLAEVSSGQSVEVDTGGSIALLFLSQSPQKLPVVLTHPRYGPSRERSQPPAHSQARYCSCLLYYHLYRVLSVAVYFGLCNCMALPAFLRIEYFVIGETSLD
jgi:hypothetical protein